METQTRREFISETGKATMAGLGAFSAATWDKKIHNMFIHHVYFWLKRPGNADDKKALVEGLRKLSAVSTIRTFQIGEPAKTRREVIDSSYDISWLVLFDNAADQDSYQVDPIHLKFVEECKLLWEKVVVYDTVEVKP
ncbi:Dabb family protein [Flavihumibacter rivuli]|uniref:Dabb family protein n=1 Tax=Flavihumibacter rivuli TaxID=2838156 RepID=UPI001BDDEC37|nr:Dabb family protein [Flavihumibacter rivuli]ULQ55513.1 Dabb family protein [Flavihumibacter rivuli]